MQVSNYDFLLKRAYFLFKPLMPRRLRISLRRNYISGMRSSYERIWPIDEEAKAPPQGWKGWPDGKQFALVLTHDVETAEGQEKCIALANLEETLGVKSSFNFIAKQYKISPPCQVHLREKGFEVGLHGLIHNGNPFRSKKVFQEQALEINRYLEDWGAAGFRCPSMYHNLEWIGELNVEYDSSTFDTDPFEPQPDGVRTIFPFVVRRGPGGERCYLELPYTLPQDHTLFVVLREKNIDIWKRKLDWIAEHGGMALLITHPDYMDFGGERDRSFKYPVGFYMEFLEYANSKYAGKFWNALPLEIARFWKSRDRRE